MKNEDFFLLVQMMRDAQKEYFRTREIDKLQESKRLEKEVDKALLELLTGQTTLF